MIRCTQCGRKLRSKEYFCSNCGTPRPETEMKEVRVSSWKATLALILGIISMIAPFFALIWPIPMGVLGLTSSVVAIVFAILSRRETNRRLSGIALVGMILALLGLCIALIVLMFGLVYLIMEPFLPDFGDAAEVYNWLHANYGEEAAETFETFMFLWE